MTQSTKASPGVSADTAIANLLASYAFLNDDADLPGLGDLFADAVFTLDGAQARGRDEVMALAGGVIQRREDGLSSTAHEVTNLFIELGEATGAARARAYWTVYRNIPGEPRTAVLSGRYDCRFREQEGVWRFTECHATSTWRAEIV